MTDHAHSVAMALCRRETLRPARTSIRQPTVKRTLCAICLVLFPSICFAGARHFTFIYEAPTSPAGSIESENWATTRFSDGFTDADFRHEIEIGITEHFQASIYFANWDYTRSQENRGAHYDSSSLELIYNLTNPVADPIGISLYQEISAGRRAFESETKLIAQKNFGPLILAYNLTLEAEWTEEESSRT